MMAALRCHFPKGRLCVPDASTRTKLPACTQVICTSAVLLVLFCDCFATGHYQTDTTFYEFRTYTVKPSMMPEFMRLANENMYSRTRHSELIGYFTMELGGLNKVLHIWKYDNFTERTTVRENISQDADFMNYTAIAAPMVDKQYNEIAYLLPWCKLRQPEKQGVYEFVTFQLKPGGLAIWGDAFRATISAYVNTSYTELVGVFNTEYGSLNQVHVLWWYENEDSRAAGRRLAHEDARVAAAVRESVRFLVSQKNVLLLPTAFSPLK